MSDLLNSASLVMIPSGYKEDTVFSAIPTDGSGDLSFTRASNGTRVNSAGLVEVCPWNLLEYSEDFSNGVWNPVNSGVTANTTTAPNGTTTADSLLETTATGEHRFWQRPALISGQDYTFTMYVKQNGRKRFQIKIFDSTSVQASALFDVSTGTIVATNGVSTITSVGDGWYRCSIVATSPTTSIGYTVLDLCTDSYSQSTAAESYTGDASKGVYVWGAQLNIGSTAKPYFPTTDRLNVPRLTYQNGGGGCPSLLLEKQSTNFAIYSQDLTQSVSFLTGGSVTDNNTTSPDGTQNADKFTVNSASSGHTGFYESPNGTNGSPFTASIFLKAGTGRYFLFRAMTGTYATRYGITIDLQSGTILSTNTAGSPTGTASKIENFGNGWYRVSLTMNCINTQIAYVWSASNSATPSLDSNLDYSYTGNGTDSYYIWGMTLEKSSYPTSYIPTTSASATRVADVCSKTGISSLIGQTQGTIFWDGVATQGDFNQLMFIKDSSSIQFIGLTVASGIIYGEVYNGGYVHLFSLSIASNATRFKLALAYKTNDFAFYVNGTQVATASTGTTPTSFDDLYLNNINDTRDFNCEIKQAIVFSTRLSNSELQSLTTL